MKAETGPDEPEKPASFVESAKYIKLLRQVLFFSNNNFDLFFICILSSNNFLFFSSDKKIFYVNKDVCEISKLLTKMINDDKFREAKIDLAEGEENSIPVALEAEILEICIKFMHYKTV